jgi:hypothetical protein
MEQCEIRGNGNSQSPDSALLHPGYLAAMQDLTPSCLQGEKREHFPAIDMGLADHQLPEC